MIILFSSRKWWETLTFWWQVLEQFNFFTPEIQPSGRLLNSFRNSHLMSSFFFFQTWHTGTYLPLLVIITLQTYSKERGILLHSQRISVLPHTLPFCCRRMLWNVDSTCQCLRSNVFPHSDNRLSTSQLLFCLTSRHEFRPLKSDSSLALTCLFLPAMEFHENLHDLAVKEGLKGRKLHKAVESFTWNITILKVRYIQSQQAVDQWLLRYSNMRTLQL